MPDCICGHGPRSHYESTDDGSGCTHCKACDRFQPDDDKDDDERPSQSYRAMED